MKKDEKNELVQLNNISCLEQSIWVQMLNLNYHLDEVKKINEKMEQSNKKISDERKK